MEPAAPPQKTSWFAKTFEGSDALSIIAAIASIAVVGAGLGLTGPLLSLLMEQKGISASIIGANTAVAGLAAMFAVPFVTPLARQIGVVNVLAAAIAISAVCLVAFYVTDPIPMWFVLRFIMSLCLSAVFVLSEFWINHAASEKKRGVILGIYGTLLSVGFAIGPAIVSLVGIEGFLPFFIGACILVAAIFPVLIAKRGQPVMDEPGKTPSIIPYLYVVPLATGAGFVFGAAEQSQLSLLPVFGALSEFSTTEAALLLTVLGIGNVVFQLPLGMWSDRVKDRRVILLTCTLAGIGGACVLPFVIGNLWITYLTIFLWGGAIGGLYIVGLAHLGSRMKGTDLAQANAAFVLCYATGMMIGPQMVGISMDLVGTNGFALGLGVLFVAYLILYAFRMRALR